jgi:hypothetical protein
MRLFEISASDLEKEPVAKDDVEKKILRVLDEMRETLILLKEGTGVGVTLKKR